MAEPLSKLVGDPFGPVKPCTACQVLAALERFQAELVELGHEVTAVRITRIGGAYCQERDIPLGPGRALVGMPERTWEEHGRHA